MRTCESFVHSIVRITRLYDHQTWPTHFFEKFTRCAKECGLFFFLVALSGCWLAGQQTPITRSYNGLLHADSVMSCLCLFFYCPEMHTAIVHVFLTCTVAYLGVGLEAVSLVVGFFPTKATSLSASILLCNNKNKYSGLWILKTFRKLIFPLSTDWLIGLQTPSVSITCSILNNIQASALGCHKHIWSQKANMSCTTKLLEWTLKVNSVYYHSWGF